MDVSLIIKSRSVFLADTQAGTFVYVFLVVTRENAKMKYSDCEVIFVPFYSDTDWLGKVDLYFLFVTALFSNRLFHKLIGKRFVAFIREFNQIATATSTTAVVDAVSWGEYVL